jgi:capsular polysaccharide transport system permease protein
MMSHATPSTRGQPAGLLAAAGVQARVLQALLAREILTRYGRHNIGFAWVFAEPMLFTLGIAWLWSMVKAVTMPGVSIAAFALTGYSSVLVWRNAATRATQALSTNWALLYHRIVTPLDLYIARITLEVVAATGSLLGLSVLFILAGWMAPPADLFKVLLAWALLCGYAYAFGLFVGALAASSEAFERLWHMLTYLLFPVSGAVFMVHWLTPAAREAVLWLPMVHGVEMLRSGWFGAAVQTYEDPVYLLGATLVLAAAGLLLVRQGGRRVEPH